MLEDPSVSTQTQWRMAATSYNKKMNMSEEKEDKHNNYLVFAVGFAIVFAILVYVFVTHF